jgi:flagellar biosynthetic protein FlhB
VAGEDRSQQATPKRRLEARKKGQVVRSRELTSALGLLSVVVLLGWRAGIGVGAWHNLLSQMLDRKNAGELGMINGIVSALGATLMHSVAGPFAAVWTITLLSSLAQGGIVFSPEALQPKWGRMNPIANLSNLFSSAGLSRMLKSLIPVVVILFIAIGITQRDWMSITTSSRASVRLLLGWMAGRWYEVSWKCGLVLLAWSVADYFLQRWHLSKSLKMTRREVSRESRDAEASPLMRGQIRKRRRELRKRWTIKDIERATAVVTNPNHFAVALEYRPQSMSAPMVVAKGMNDVALRIKEAARWHSVPIVENPVLAQALFRATEVGEAIPAKLYTAVAEILAFLYRAQANLRNSMHAARAAAGSPSGARR